MKFIVYINQTDFGCDYTIACGKVLRELKAETLEDAIAEVRKYLAPSLKDDEPIFEANSATIYQVENKHPMPIQEWYNERQKEEEDYKLTQEKEKERLEYERLKVKFG